jgi:hypothetical protein
MVLMKRSTIAMSSSWHQLEFEVNGNALRVWWDRGNPIEASDAPLRDGRVGILTRANSLKYFHDFSVQPL